MKWVRRTLFTVILILILLAAVLWAFSPALVRTFAKEPLATQGVILDEESSVRLNLFGSSLNLSDVKLTRNNSTTYSLDHLTLKYSLFKLIFSEIYIKQLHVEGMQLLVIQEGQETQIAGFNIPSNSDESPSETDENQENSNLLISAPNISFNDINIQIVMNGNEHNLYIEQLELNNTEFLQGLIQTDINLDALIDEAELKLQAELRQQIENTQLQIEISLQQISSQNYAYFLPENITQLQTYIDLDSEASLTLEGGDLRISSPELKIALSELNYEDELVHASWGELDLTLNDVLVELLAESSILSVDTQGEFQLNNLQADLLNDQGQLLGLQQLEIGSFGISASQNDYQFISDNILLNDLLLSQGLQADLEPLFLTNSISFEQISVGTELIAIEKISLDEGAANLFINSEGEFLSLIDLDSLTSTEPETVATEDQNQTSGTTTTPIIQLGHFEISSPLLILVEDQSNNQSFNKTFSITEAYIRDLDTSIPLQESSFLLSMKDESYFTSTIEGWIKPFTDEVNLQVNANLSEFSLHEVAPYLKDTLGFEVEAGQIDAVFEGEITESIMDTQLDLLMRGAELGASQTANEESNLIGQTAIPLNVALNMLKDGDGNIELNLPITGDINDPSFSLQGVIALVVKKVAMNQAQSYLLNMFVPYASVVSIAYSAGTEALKVSFEDLNYSSGQVELLQEQSEFVSQMSQLLLEEEELQVKMCSIATPADLMLATDSELNQTQQEQLLELATQRAETLKEKLVNDGIASSRLLLCSPSIDQGEDGQPRIEFET